MSGRRKWAVVPEVRQGYDGWAVYQRGWIWWRFVSFHVVERIALEVVADRAKGARYFDEAGREVVA